MDKSRVKFIYIEHFKSPGKVLHEIFWQHRFDGFQGGSAGNSHQAQLHVSQLVHKTQL